MSRQVPTRKVTAAEARAHLVKAEEFLDRVAPDPPPAGLRGAVGRARPPLAGVAGPERRQWAG